MIDGWRAKADSPNLTFGIHYHSALETYDKLRAAGQSHDEATIGAVRKVMIDSFGWVSNHNTKNRETLVRSIIWYVEEFKDHSMKTWILANGKAAVELSFRIELEFAYADGDQPYMLSGHIDRIVEFDGDIYATDRKTTKSALNSQYFTNYAPDNQMSLYSMATKVVFSTPIRGVIIDAAQVMVGFTRYLRGMTDRTAAQTEEWLHEVKYWIRQAEGYAEEGYWPMNDSACLSGDTIVSVTRGSRAGWKMSIKQLAEISKQPRYDKKLNTFLLSDVGGYASNQKLLEIIKTGTKQIFLLKTGRGTEIKATADHRFKMSDGEWKRLDELKVGNSLLYWDKGRQGNNNSIKQRAIIFKLYYYPRGWKSVNRSERLGIKIHRDSTKQRKSVLTVEAAINGLSLDEFLIILRTDKAKADTLKYLDDSIEVHHKDGNELNDSPNNLIAVTIDEHKKFHPSGPNSKKFVSTNIISISSLGEEEVYDIAMEGPHHNFIANNLVAHNCGKFGGCVFRGVCSKDPSVRETFLNTDFAKQERWNPLKAR